MKGIILSFIGIICFVQLTKGQRIYLSDIPTKSDNRNSNGYLTVPFNYWRYDTCLYNKKSLCKYNHSTAADVKVYQSNGNLNYEFLRGNNSGYQSKNPYDTFKYVFITQNPGTTIFIRKLLIKDIYVRVDTFHLTVLDTLIFTNPGLLKNVFGKSEIGKQNELKIFVLRSIDSAGSTMLHYWVEGIGIIKLTDEKCWRYSFEMRDNRTKTIVKMFARLIQVIKAKYKDPYWLSQPCSVE
jgi:hypothetical protein